MTYGMMVTVPLPIEVYEAVHAEVQAVQGDRAVPGLVVHFARPTAEGYQLVEVWESKADSDRFYEQVVNPIVDRIAAGSASPPSPPVVEEFEARGLITQPAGQRAAQPTST